MSKFINIFKSSKKYKLISIIIVLVVLCVLGYLLFSNKSSAYQFVTVHRGSITESIHFTGSTTSTQNVSLAFGSSGIVSRTYSALGKQVFKGQVLAKLNNNDLLAQLHNAQAGLTIAKQNASVSTDSLTNIIAQQNILVETAYQNLLNSSLEAVPEDSDKNYLAPVITGNYTLGKEGKIKLHYYYSSGGISFEASGLTNGTGMSNDITSQPIGGSGLYITSTSKIIENDDWIIEIPNKKATNYLTNYNTYQLALKNRDKAIADAQANIETTDSSSVVDAQIAQAQAGVDSILAKIENARIIAPISGTITQFDTKIGQVASSNVPLISVISSDDYEVDAKISEIDIGKVLLGNKATMTFDAFPNETFTGSVFYIAPAETNTQGVVNYLVKISFDKPDLRLKSELTANIDIQTKQKDNILILPQNTIIRNNKGTFVEILENDKAKDIPVTLGIQNKEGDFELISGLVEGEQILDIGTKDK